MKKLYPLSGFIKQKFILVFCLLNCSASLAQGGLTFISNDKPKDERTRYSVFDKGIKFKKLLEVSFDLSFYSPLFIGEMLTIKNKRTQTAFSLYYKYTYNEKNESFIQINRKGEKKLYESKIPDDLIVNGSWLKFKIALDFENNKIIFDFNGERVEIAEKFESKEDKYDLIFGKHDIYFDVPSFKIRNLQVTSSDFKIEFPLSQREGNDVYNKNQRYKGYVENPYWLIGDFYHWKKVKSFLFKNSANVVYDELNSYFYLLADTYLLRYNILNNKVDSIPYANSQKFVSSLTGKAIIDNEKKSIYVYKTSMNRMINNSLLVKKLGLIVDDDKIISDSKNIKDSYTIASLDLGNFEWKKLSDRKIFDEIRFHNNTILKPEINSFFMFGGYSNFNYHNDFIKYNLSTQKLNNISFTGDKISPRFFAGHAMQSDNKLLIYGGVGNLSGEEHIGKKYFDDLYEVDLNSQKITKKWQYENSSFQSASSENLILSSDNKYFYNVSFAENILNSKIQLKKIKIEDGSSINLGDTVPFKTNKFPNEIDLYQIKKNKRLILYKQEYLDNNIESNKISFYTIEFEPVTYDHFNQGQAIPFNYIFYKYLVTLIALILLLCFYLIWRKRQIKKNKEKDDFRDYLFVRANRQNIKISIDDIWAVEALKDYIKIVCKEKNYIVHSNLSKFSSKLSDDKFVRIHRSFIVNISKITSIDGDTLYLDKRYYKIGGKFSEDVKDRLNINKS